MNVRNLLSYAIENNSDIFFQSDAAAIISSNFIMFYGNDTNEPMQCCNPKNVENAFGRKTITNVKIDGDTIIFGSRDSKFSVICPKVSPSPTDVNMKPLQSWAKDIFRDDFLQRTTHIKIGMDGFCRGKIDDNKWRPAKINMDNFDGLIYDATIVNMILRDYSAIPKITICDYMDQPDVTPIFLTFGAFKIILPGGNICDTEKC